MPIKYEQDGSGELWWCNVHQRRATFLFTPLGGTKQVKHVCAPHLGGITMPCRCVNLTGQVELDYGHESKDVLRD